MKAYNIAPKYTDEAIKLLDFAIKHFSDDIHSLASLYQAKGNIFEDYKHNYLKAYEFYTKWAELKTNLGGHEFLRIRALLRYNKLRVNKEIVNFFKENRNEIIGEISREYRFWIDTLTSGIYQYNGLKNDSIRLAKRALEVYNEIGPSVLNRTSKNLENIEDKINVTPEEIQILKKRL